MRVLTILLFVFSSTTSMLASDQADKTQALRTELEIRDIALERLALDVRHYQIRAQQSEIERGAVQRSGLWPSQPVSVCWEDGPNVYADEKSWVRDAVAKTWEKESAVRFSGWQQCLNHSAGIRVAFNDEGPHVKNLGQNMSGVPQGMVLNPKFGNWNRSCAFPESQRQSCIRSIAVHEFGHALAFAHEQNRPDAPLDCQKERQGTTGDWNVTLYDPDSVMNYCNLRWNNNGQLSPLDVVAVRTLYGNPSADNAARPAR